MFAVCKLNRKRICDLLIYMLFMILMILTIHKKENLYVDEVYSYGLSNYHGDIYMEVESGRTYYPAGVPWAEYMTVDENGRFDYSNVWKNQEQDVHPPLYYAILHTICSFLPGSFSIWFAAAINIFAALGTLYFLGKLVLLLTGDERVQRLISIAFVCSAGILSAVSFLRMYMLAMLWVTALTYLLIEWIGENGAKKFCVPVFLCTAGGALTHYYCIVYTIFISIVFGCILLLWRRWKETGALCLIQGMAAVVSLGIFPAMMGHVLASGRGRESVENFFGSSLLDGLVRIRLYFNLLDGQLFGGIFVYFFFASLILLTICVQGQYARSIKEKKIVFMRYVCICIPIVLYFLLISKISVFLTDRYMYPIYAVLFLAILSGLSLWIKGRNRSQYIYVLAGLLSIITVNGWKMSEWEYLYRDSKTLLDTASAYADVDCVFVYDRPWKINPSYYETSRYHSVTFFTPEDLKQLYGSDLSSRYHLIVMITDDEEEILTQLMEICPDLNTYMYLGGYGYTNTYYLYGEQKD